MSTDTLGATERELIEFRKKKLEKLVELGVNPYPSRSDKNITAELVHAQKEQLMESGNDVVVSGRIVSLRGHGKLAFVDLEDQSGKIQVMFRQDNLPGLFARIELLDLGDFVEVSGNVFVTNSGETTISAKLFNILTKSLRPLPDKHFGISDEETRFRKRYLELALDPTLRELFIKKAKFWQATRQFLVDENFLEVETPALENTAGGADANPFVTHHDALDIDVFLRISMGELWQKRLMVGGFEKTFEIGRQFRNEGISREHLQDYSQMEFYWAYANYEDSMALVQRLYKHIAEKTFGTLEFKIGNFEINLDGDWEKIDYTSTIKEKLGIDVMESSEEELINKIKELGLKLETGSKRGRLVDTLWKHIRKNIAGPVFLINHPVEVSPLAKRKTDNPRLVERYQVILAGSEMGNGYSELNDPQDQEQRFLEQAKMREEGDAEAQMHDRDFVEALEYGMPPTTGFGFSERLFSFLANKSSREAVIFPLMKPVYGEDKK